MIISIDAGGSLLLIFGIIFAVIILSMLLKKGDFKKKILSLIIILVAFAFVFIMFGRPSKLIVDDEGINSTSYGKIDFDWKDINRAVLVAAYQSSPYKPVLKLTGTAVKDFRAGTFKLSNGETAKLITQSAEDAAVFYTGDKIYLLAIDELDKLIDIASDYVQFE
jgi:hypothetical protein